MGFAYSLRFLVVLMRISCGCVDLCDCCFVYVTVVTVVVVLAYGVVLVFVGGLLYFGLPRFLTPEVLHFTDFLRLCFGVWVFSAEVLGCRGLGLLLGGWLGGVFLAFDCDLAGFVWCGVV